MLDPRRLLTFREVARLGSFSRAAEELSLTQPAVSQQILSLERQPFASRASAIVRKVVVQYCSGPSACNWVVAVICFQRSARACPRSDRPLNPYPAVVQTYDHQPLLSQQ